MTTNTLAKKFTYLSPDERFSLLLAESARADYRCEPPLSEDGVVKIARSVSQYGPGSRERHVQWHPQ